MPNIEIWGLDWKEALDESIKIRNIIGVSNLPFKNDVVVTTIGVRSHCVDLTGKSQPFLRICDTDRKRIEKLIKFLDEFDFNDEYDIEVLILHRFYLKNIKS